MLDSPVSEAPSQSVPSPAPLNLQVRWAWGPREFLENAGAVLGSAPPSGITALRAPFWPDVFVERPVAWRSMSVSALYHILAVVVIYSLSVNWPQRAPVRTQSPFDNTKITYYNVSEYLPEINTGEEPAPAKLEQKGKPKFAKQRIISIPKAPDNFRQTIVTPSQIKLPNDVALPNLVAWTPIPSSVPEAALTQTLPKVPAINPDVVAPAPATENLRAKSAAGLPVEVVAPAPSLDTAKSKLPNLPEPSVVEPPPPTTGRQLGTMNVARLDPTVAEPKLPLHEQRAAAAGGGTSAGGGAQNASAPPPANVVGIGDGKQAAGRLIALGLDPAAVDGPINIPNGSRTGQFAATPEGDPNAAGTPDIRGGGTAGNGASGHGNGNGNRGGSGPPGIMVGRPPGQPTSAIGGNAADPSKSSADPKLMASLERSRAAELARRLSPANLDAPGRIEDKVFGSKRYYSMTLNMPNLTSAGGSWIIRFAELDETTIKGGDVIAPQAMLKVDPAYPAELMRDHVEGTVTLYAVIRKDGTVGEVKVLRGVEERLDENARVALSRWKFHPATKNGSAVDLEAVVQIPFAVRRLPF